ncbi:MAG: hypothetical protein V1792_25595 [Pseudomonadota bacterium]
MRKNSHHKDSKAPRKRRRNPPIPRIHTDSKTKKEKRLTTKAQRNQEANLVYSLPDERNVELA